MSSESTRPPSVLPWKLGPDEAIAQTPIFALRKRRATSRANPERSGEFVYLDSADWVNVIALTPEREVLLIEQFRHGLAEVTVEIPGGIVDPGESPLAAGVRELLEETGFEGTEARLIGRVAPNPAILDNFCHTVLVSEARRRADPQLEEHEEIGVRLLPLARVPSLIREGQIQHALVIAAFYWLALEGLL